MELPDPPDEDLKNFILPEKKAREISIPRARESVHVPLELLSMEIDISLAEHLVKAGLDSIEKIREAFKTGQITEAIKIGPKMRNQIRRALQHAGHEVSRKTNGANFRRRKRANRKNSAPP